MKPALPRPGQKNREELGRTPGRKRLAGTALDDLLVRAKNPQNPVAVLNLGAGLGWRITALPGMEEHLLLIKEILELRGEPGGGSFSRLVLAGPQPGGDSAGSEEERTSERPSGWQSIELRGADVYIRRGSPDSICCVSGGANPAREDAWLHGVLLPVYLRVIEAGGMVLHSAVIQRNGEAVLLAGKAGAGKSTCCRRVSLPWRALCDDLCLAVPGPAKSFLIHPLPTWSSLADKGNKLSWPMERCLPLKAIFFLEKAEEDESLVLGKAEAAALLLWSAVAGTFHWRSGLDLALRKKMERKLLDAAIEAVKFLPALRLRVSRDGAFWSTMEKALALSAPPGCCLRNAGDLDRIRHAGGNNPPLFA